MQAAGQPNYTSTPGGFLPNREPYQRPAEGSSPTARPQPGSVLLALRLVEREDVGVGDASAKSQLAALGALLRAQRVSAELSLRQLSERTNVSNAYLSELERGLHEPSLRVLRAIAAALGTPLVSTLARAGVLGGEEDDRPGGLRETEAAILRDPELSEPQRTALLSVYRSFVSKRSPS